MSDKKTVTFIMTLPEKATIAALLSWAVMFTVVGYIELAIDNELPILLSALMFGCAVRDYASSDDEYVGQFSLTMFRYRLLRMGVGCLGVAAAGFFMFDQYVWQRALVWGTFPFLAYTTASTFLPAISAVSVTNKYKYQDMWLVRCDAHNAVAVALPLMLIGMLNMDLIFTLRDYRILATVFIVMLSVWGALINPKFKE